MATAFERLSTRSRDLVLASKKKAQELDLPSISNEALLLAMLEEEGSAAARTLVTAHPHIRVLIEARIAQDNQTRVEPVVKGQQRGPHMHPSMVEALDFAFYEAAKVHVSIKDPEHILLSLLRHDVNIQRWLMDACLIDYIEIYEGLKSELLALQAA